MNRPQRHVEHSQVYQHIHNMSASKEEIVNETEIIFEESIAENFPNLIKTI